MAGTPQRTDLASVLRTFSTEEVAAILHVQPQTLRAALCRNGHYLGMTPVKRANRFLAWPAIQVEAVARGDGA